MSKKRNQKNQYQQRPKRFTPPRQLGITLRYAKLCGTDDRYASLYREIDIELRSFNSFDQEGKVNGKYFRLNENTSTINTFEKIGEAERGCFDIVTNRVKQGWTMIKGDSALSSYFLRNK